MQFTHFTKTTSTGGRAKERDSRTVRGPTVGLQTSHELSLISKIRPITLSARPKATLYPIVSSPESGYLRRNNNIKTTLMYHCDIELVKIMSLSVSVIFWD